MGSTPNYGWRLPDQTTAPPDVVLWMANLGNDIETTMTNRVRAGSSLLTTSANGDTPIISFGAPAFATAPVVLAMLGDTGAGGAGYVVINKAMLSVSGFAAVVYTKSGLAAAGLSVRINWIAVGG